MKTLKRVMVFLLFAAALLSMTACASVEIDTREADALGSVVGVVEGNRYENKRLLLGCELPENWQVADDEERLAMIGQVAGKGDSGDFAKLVERAGTWYDLYAHTEDDTERISITIERAAIFNRMVYTAKDLVNGTAKSLPQSLESMGLTVQIEQGEKKLANSNRDYVFATGSNEETTIYMEVFYIKTAKYYACITLSAKDENTIPAMEEMFYETGAF